MITAESLSGARPEPSISVAPVIAMTVGEVDWEGDLLPEDVLLTKTAAAEAMRIAVIRSFFISIIPKGFKLIAVGERCATPTDSIERGFDPEGVALAATCSTLSGSVKRFVDNSVGVAQGARPRLLTQIPPG